MSLFQLLHDAPFDWQLTKSGDTFTIDTLSPSFRVENKDLEATINELIDKMGEYTASKGINYANNSTTNPRSC